MLGGHPAERTWPWSHWPPWRFRLKSHAANLAVGSPFDGPKPKISKYMSFMRQAWVWWAWIIGRPLEKGAPEVFPSQNKLKCVCMYVCMSVCLYVCMYILYYTILYNIILHFLKGTHRVCDSWKNNLMCISCFLFGPHCRLVDEWRFI